MRTPVDLTAPGAALAWLRSLPAGQEIDLPGQYESVRGDNDIAACVVRVITGLDANTWATRRNRWIWTAGELLTALSPDIPLDDHA